MTFFVPFRFCCVFCRLNGHSSHPSISYPSRKRGLSLKAALIAQLYKVDTFSAFDAFSLNHMSCYAHLISTCNTPRKQGLFLKEGKTKTWSECILSNGDRQFFRGFVELTVIVLVQIIYIMHIVACALTPFDGNVIHAFALLVLFSE